MELFVPGRLCILGEHTDWAAEYVGSNADLCAGHTLVCATNEGLYARVFSHTNGMFKFESTNDDGEVLLFEAPLTESVFREKAEAGGFLSYVFGAVAVILESLRFKETVADVCAAPGLYLENYRTTLPMRKGLSSSAAICVLTVQAFDSHYHLRLSQAEVMELAYRGEMLTPSHCGRMDQCVVMGAGALAAMRFEGDRCSLDMLRIAAPLFFAVVDLKAGKDTVAILRDLNACFPRAATPTQALMHRYVHDIEHIAERSYEAIARGDVDGLAAAMQEAQRSFDTNAMPNCLSQLTSPKLHMLIEDKHLQSLSLAVKGVGSQGDGAAQVLCRTAEQQRAVLEHVRRHHGMEGFPLTILTSSVEDSAFQHIDNAPEHTFR